MASTLNERPPSDATDTYERDVLHLSRGQTEVDLELSLRTQAQELGLILDTPSEEPTSPTVQSEQSSRYSASVDSRVSISTGLTSILSDRVSVYSNNALDHARSTRSSDLSASRRQSVSSSMFSVSSSSTNQSKSPFRRIGLSMLRLNRSSSKGCPHCPKDPISQRRALHELPCGHRLCTQALRNVVVESTRHDPEIRCCGQIIPEHFIRYVLNDEGYETINNIGSTPLAPSRPPMPQSSLKSQVDRPAPTKEKKLAIPSGEHQTLAVRYEAESGRLEVWLARLKDDLKQQRTAMLKILQEHHAKALDDQAETQSHDMLVAEDRQVKAEADLRNMQDQEIRDNATRLRHMEAYCAGKLASGDSHNRVITEQDLLELQKTQNVRDAMEMKHRNAINILRGEQTRRMKLRAQRYDKDVHQLKAQHRKECLALEQRYRTEEASLIDDAGQRRQRLYARWRLETMICTKRLEVANESVSPTGKIAATAS
ncbi:hypothetical protein AMS68_003922 [Peltaster fructicola]|uniref:Uncharacterized protein n=1 Tax=Peltaster fructicola TaxID=286661 RepID=A0A6H0XUS3_9PEZI|nr:hypothetical protein AMS68_003922 [Peltaster fructicola]